MSGKVPKPTKKGKEFKKYWYLFIENLLKRDNFDAGYLKNLEILCLLYTTFDDYSDTIEKEGYTYESEGRNGYQLKVHPLVAERQKVLAEIRAYSKLLGLILIQDKQTQDDPDKDQWE